MSGLTPERSTDDAARKTFTNCAARAALAGWQLWRSDAADGPQRFFLGRAGSIRVLADLVEVQLFIDAVAAK